jgi:opacity protein-like surface antigen
MRRLRLLGFVLRFTLASLPAGAADLPVPAGTPVRPPVVFGPDPGRFYLSLHGGVGFLQDPSIDYVNGALPSRGVSVDNGWTIVGAAGWQITPWWRTELELGRRSNDVNTITPGAAASGSIAATTLMVNGYLDFPNRSLMTPYIGAGVGKAWVSHNLIVDGGTLAGTTSWPWAYQLLGGANLAIAPRWSVSLEYRFLGTQRGLFQDTQGLFYNADYNNHSVLLGVTWRPL